MLSCDHSPELFGNPWTKSVVEPVYVYEALLKNRRYPSCFP